METWRDGGWKLVRFVKWARLSCDVLDLFTLSQHRNEAAKIINFDATNSTT